MQLYWEIGKITNEIAKLALKKLEIDDLGLDNIDRKILETIVYNYSRWSCWNRHLVIDYWGRSRNYRGCL